MIPSVKSLKYVASSVRRLITVNNCSHDIQQSQHQKSQSFIKVHLMSSLPPPSQLHHNVYSRMSSSGTLVEVVDGRLRVDNVIRLSDASQTAVYRDYRG